MFKPLPAITTGFIGGIVLSLFYLPEPKFIILLAIVSFGIAVGNLYLTRWNSRRVYVFITLFLILGWSLAGLEATRIPGGVESYAGRFITLQGTVIQEPQVRPDDVIYKLAAEVVVADGRAEYTRGLVQVRTPVTGPVYGYGDRLQVRGMCYLPQAPGNFGAFNYQAYLERRGIYALLKSAGPEEVKILEAGAAGHGVVRLALGVKQGLAGAARQTLDQQQAAILSGLLFGDRNQIDKSVQKDFARIGVAHVLCVSGLHVGCVLAGVLLLANFLRLSRGTIPLLVFPVLVFYIIMTGAGPAAIRAGIMAMVVLGATYWGRERDWPSVLSLAALVILIGKPSLLFEVGFQLSFGATWGILYLGPWLEQIFSRWWKLPRWLSVPLQITMAAQLGTLPLLVYHFNLLAVIAPLANLLLVPLVGLIMLAGFLGSVVGLVLLPLGAVINITTGLFIDIFVSLAGLLEHLPGGTVYLATPPWIAVILWYVGLVLLVEIEQGKIKLPGGRERVKIVAVALAGLLLVLVIWPWGGTRGQLEVHFIDVGQGDCILVRFPGGSNMLVDTGGKIGDLAGGRVVGDAVVVPYLQRLGINRLEVLVITHLHGDHAGGLPAVLDNFKVKALVTSMASGLVELVPGASFKQTPIYEVQAGQVLHVHRKADVLVLGPGPGFSTREEELNNTSVVLRLDYGDVSFLLTGDIEESAQRELMARGWDLRADILKVPHHGSRFFDISFVEAVAPVYAVIQVGANNPFGHPAKSTLEALSATGATILRNDRDGAVIISTNGEQIKVQTAR